MIKAELSYNPYTMETYASFNNNPPHINSLIEKYKNMRLQDWISDVPRVFYEELNGYDFELEFQGTEMEYIALQKVFREKVKTEDNVIVTHTKTIGDRKSKLNQIDDLFIWLRDNKSDYLDFEEFCTRNNEIIDVHYPLFIVNGQERESESLGGFKISAEYISDIKELENTNLKYTPFIFFIDGVDLDLIQCQINELRNKKDVVDSQLFFIIQEKSRIKNIERFLKDLGIEKPLIIEDINDEFVLDYLTAYPISQHIYESCKTFEEEETSISEILKNVKNEKEAENSEKYNRIEGYSKRIEKIENAKEKLINRDPFYMPTEWRNHQKSVIAALSKFKDKNAVLVGKEYATKNANKYQEEVDLYLNAFKGALDDNAKEIIKIFENKYFMIYANSEINESIDLKSKLVLDIECEIPDIREKLLNCRVEKIVEDRPLFAKKDEPPKKILRLEYVLSEWRKIAIESVDWEIERVIKKYHEELKKYFDSIANEYIVKLEDKDVQLKKEKKKEVEGLSEEEKRLENNITWFKEFHTKIDSIERA